MGSLELFPSGSKIGVFRGFRDGGMEFHADLTLPYREEFRNSPMHGQFVLVQLDTLAEAILGRIAALSSDGKLSAGSGEEYNIRAIQENRQVPEDLRERYLRYRVNIRVLGVLRSSGEALTFIASLRRLPPAGSAVAFPTEDVLQEITGHNAVGATIGHLALGEFFYGPQEEAVDDRIQVQDAEAQVNFDVSSLVSRRTFVFARAGFGKSNLTKLLFSTLYSETPTVTKRLGKEVPVGTVIFDPDGEYFWPDDKGRPGFCDVDGMTDNLVIFTSRRAPSEFYGSFVAADTKLDIRRLPASDVVGLFLEPERQSQQNVIKLRAMNNNDWAELVDLIDDRRQDASLDHIRELLRLEQNQEMEAVAAKTNMVRIVRALHDSSSRLMDMLKRALKDGKLCIVDVSQMSQEQALVLSGLVLRNIFQHNQDEFTESDPQTIPTIAVVEEAQAVLNEKATAAQPYISWVKEGRKYDLGAVLVTQQPGSIPKEILSQGDNWFLFHLLSSGDLRSVGAANAHFGEDLLASLLNEPIPGHGVFWSSAAAREYPVPIKVRSFNDQHALRDPQFNSTAVETYAGSLRSRMTSMKVKRTQKVEGDHAQADVDGVAEDLEAGDDFMRDLDQDAIRAFSESEEKRKVETDNGIAWGALNAFFKRVLPDDLDGRDDYAYNLVPKALNQIYGRRGWEAYTPEGRTSRWVRAKSDS